VFLVSDGWDPSTTELLRKLSGALGVPSLLVPLPTGLVMTAARLLGRGAAADRLFGNLQVDISMTTEVLNWTPPVSFEDGLRIAVEP
jgi:nucleoside-diphosphate-sugar epimerase